MIQQLSNTTGKGRRRTIGPMDSGRLMTLEEFERADETPGFVFELIDGVLIVSPNPSPPHDYWVQTISDGLKAYSIRNTAIINWVSDGSEIVVTGRPGPTRPQPDIAAYCDYPFPFPRSWGDVCPLVVVEIISDRREAKDTIRNRHLYWMAGGIMEYWIVDPRKDWERPALIALQRRRGAPDWKEQIVPFGKSYKSAALPGFVLNLSGVPRKRRGK